MLLNLVSRRFRWSSVLLAVFLLWGLSRITVSQESKISYNELYEETVKWSQEMYERTFVWWIPEELLEAYYAGHPFATEAWIEEVDKAVSPYTVIAVSDGKSGPFTRRAKFKTKVDIKANIKIKDSHGTRYLPISEDEISSNTKSFLASWKPVLEEAYGQWGENTHFILFPGKDKNGHRIVDPKKDGSFSVELGKKEFRWRLPLGSLVPPKICPTCGEKLNGAYKFCPWDGAKLPETKEEENI